MWDLIQCDILRFANKLLKDTDYCDELGGRKWPNFIIEKEHWDVDPLILYVHGGGGGSEENNEWTNIQQMNGPFTL